MSWATHVPPGGGHQVVLNHEIKDRDAPHGKVHLERLLKLALRTVSNVGRQGKGRNSEKIGNLQLKAFGEGPQEGVDSAGLAASG